MVVNYFLQIIKAPITPGTQAQRVRRNTIITEPHPLSITARGGKIMQRITRQSDIVFSLLRDPEKPKLILY
jgi:hypothetical protein